jgi:hypothetical protein
MADKNIGAIVIKDQDKLTGIFSENRLAYWNKRSEKEIR